MTISQMQNISADVCSKIKCILASVGFLGSCIEMHTRALDVFVCNLWCLDLFLWFLVIHFYALFQWIPFLLTNHFRLLLQLQIRAIRCRTSCLKRTFKGWFLIWWKIEWIFDQHVLLRVPFFVLTVVIMHIFVPSQECVTRQKLVSFHFLDRFTWIQKGTEFHFFNPPNYDTQWRKLKTSQRPWETIKCTLWTHKRRNGIFRQNVFRQLVFAVFSN